MISSRIACAIGAVVVTLSCVGCVPPDDNGYYSPSSSYDPYPTPSRYDRYDREDRYREERERERWERDRRERDRQQEMRYEESRRENERREMERERERLQAERERMEREAQQRRSEGCDSGWSARGSKCSGDERRRGCQDKRAPNGDVCVRFR